MIHLRPHRFSDIEFIYSSWLQSFRDCNPDIKNLPNDFYYKAERDWLDEFFKAKEFNVTIACHEEFPDQIFGYLAQEKSPVAHVIHFAYVKHIYRRIGVFNVLMRPMKTTELPIYYTHETYMSREIGKKWNAKFNPYMLNREGIENEENQIERRQSWPSY